MDDKEIVIKLSDLDPDVKLACLNKGDWGSGPYGECKRKREWKEISIPRDPQIGGLSAVWVKV